MMQNWFTSKANAYEDQLTGDCGGWMELRPFMKTNRRLMLAMMLVVLWGHDAQAFYNASTGRWLSRDPIEEAGGSAPYVHVGNAVVNHVDYLGQFRLDTKARTAKLSKCEIAVIYGHGSGLNNWHYKWSYSSADCSAGAAVMCYPASNMDGLPNEMRLWTKWGGVRISADDEDPTEDLPFNGLVFWGMGALDADWHVYQGSKQPNANRVLITHVLRNALVRAREICHKQRQCGCPLVLISFVQLDSNGRLVDPPRPDNGVPPMPRWIIVPCGREPKPGPINCMP